MGGDPTDRLGWKEPLHSLQVELQRDYGLSAISSRALLRRLEVFLEEQLGIDASTVRSATLRWRSGSKPASRCGSA